MGIVTHCLSANKGSAVKIIHFLSFSCLCCAGLIGCSQKETKVYDVQFLVENTEIRENLLNDCNLKIKSLGYAESVMKEPNCKNANEAEKIYTNKFNSTGGKQRMKTHVVIGENK